MRNVFFQLVYAKPDTYSSYGDTTTFSKQANQVGACFVLNDCSDDPDTSAYAVPLPTEPTEQTPFDSDSFRRCRHQEDRYFRRSCHG